MRIAIINETSAADGNADIMNAIKDRGYELLNCGMTKNGEEPQLTYLHTGLLSALLLNTRAVDFVVGGCGTGQGRPPAGAGSALRRAVPGRVTGARDSRPGGRGEV